MLCVNELKNVRNVVLQLLKLALTKLKVIVQEKRLNVLPVGQQLRNLALRRLETISPKLFDYYLTGSSIVRAQLI